MCGAQCHADTQGLLVSLLFVCARSLSSYKVRESVGSVSVTVRRVGNLNQYSIVLCRTEQGTATAGSGSQPGEQDYMEYAGQVSGHTGKGWPDHTCHKAWRKERMETDKNTEEGGFYL